MYEWFEIVIIFLCSSYRYDFLNFWISYLFKPTIKLLQFQVT